MGKAKRSAEKAAKSVTQPGVKKGKLAKSAQETQARKQNGNKAAPPTEVAQRVASTSEPTWRSREKPLVLCARGITFRYRHLMTDLMQLIPHHKTDSKLDTKHDWSVINEVAELKGATSVLFFEARKRQDLYLWIAKVPSGPSVRFLCSNVHTMAELKLSGNHLKGSRPVLSFAADFDEQPQAQVMKELLKQAFVTPKGHQKSKPFFDHVIAFSWCDNRIWLRNYQVVVALDKKQFKEEGVTLVEVGPRVTLQPIKVFAGSFRGKVLFENPEFINPNAIRSYEKKQAAGSYSQKVGQAKRKEKHLEGLRTDEGDLSDRRVFAATRAHDAWAQASQDAAELTDGQLVSDDDVSLDGDAIGATDDDDLAQ